MEFVKYEAVSIARDASLNEKWVQDRIAADPSILGLGEVIVKDRERAQPRAGRLDLLLQDAESTQRYEVEIQLGATDEGHIIRTIEYWDIERKRYPQYEHAAVLVAEDITSRFLNVIGLLNGMIPLIAVQMKALRNGNQVGLFFTKVVDLMSFGLVDEDEEVSEVADRDYWATRASTKTLAMADELLRMAQKEDPSVEPKYDKFYIGLAKEGRPFNFVVLRPKKGFIRLDARVAPSSDLQVRLEAAGLDVMEYDSRWGYFRLRLQSGKLEKHKGVLSDLIHEAYAQRAGE